jgi:rRNA small subunit aminocarboxypropyltransferase
VSPIGPRPLTPQVDVLIVHDPREPAKKCSLTPLRGMAGVRFVPMHGDERVDAGRRIWLHPEGDELGPADRGVGLLLVDCTWRRLARLSKRIDGVLVRRRLPKLVTAYPRRSKLALDPEHGLASVEALYAAIALLYAPCPELLAHYRWAAEFLVANPDLPRC